MKQHRKRYILVFIITIAIFVGSAYASFLLNQKKIGDLQNAQDQISLDILTSETEFDLLQESSCDSSDTFAKELQMLAGKIAYSEQNLSKPEEINALKKQYTLLEVRDFLLAKRVAERCHITPINIFYFYGTEVGCPECVRQGYVLDALRSQRPDVRVYAFDYHLDLSTVKALIDIYKVGETLPSLVINGVTFSGFKSLDELNAIIPQQALIQTMPKN